MTTALRGKASGARLAGLSSSRAPARPRREHRLLPRVAGAVRERRGRADDLIAPTSAAAARPARAPSARRRRARARRGPRVERDHRMSARCSTLATSPGSSLGPGREPRVEDLAELGLARSRAGSARARWRRSTCARPRRGRVAAQRGADPVHLVGGDRRAGPRPAADHGLLGAALGDVARGRLRRPRPVVALVVVERAVARTSWPRSLELVHDGVGDARPVRRQQRRCAWRTCITTRS